MVAVFCLEDNGQEKLQSAFWIAFSWKKMCAFLFELSPFHLIVKLTISPLWVISKWHGIQMYRLLYLDQCWPTCWLTHLSGSNLHSLAHSLLFTSTGKYSHSLVKFKCWGFLCTALNQLVTGGWNRTSHLFVVWAWNRTSDEHVWSLVIDVACVCVRDVFAYSSRK